MYMITRNLTTTRLSSPDESHIRIKTEEIEHKPRLSLPSNSCPCCCSLVCFLA
jgi:hypothetical protein